MRSRDARLILFFICSSSFMLSSCSTYHSSSTTYSSNDRGTSTTLAADYGSRIPQHISTGEKTVVIDPRVHVWGAYDSSGSLVRAGIASAGSSWCNDLGRPCRTSVGSFRIASLGSPSCKSHKFPIPKGGAPMPYCMYFHGGQALHGVPAHEVGEGNYSHGCVRMHVSDAEWLRYNFANVGTKVVVRSY